MCFIPFVATKSAPGLVPKSPCPPGTGLHALHPQDAAILDKFTLPHCAELKLAKGCGCWLRYVDYPTPEDMDYHTQLNVEDSNYNPAEKQDNHDSLADYLTEHFSQDGFVEFFGFFDGDPTQPARDRRDMPVSAIRHPHFHFHGGTIYRLMFQPG